MRGAHGHPSSCAREHGRDGAHESSPGSRFARSTPLPLPWPRRAPIGTHCLARVMEEVPLPAFARAARRVLAPFAAFSPGHHTVG